MRLRSTNIRQKGRKGTEECVTNRTPPILCLSLMWHWGMKQKTDQCLSVLCGITCRSLRPAASSPGMCSYQQSTSRSHTHFTSLGSALGPPEKFQVWVEEAKRQDVKSGLGREGMRGHQEFGSDRERWRGVRSPGDQSFPCALVCWTKHITVYAGGVMPVHLKDLLTEGFCMCIYIRIYVCIYI